jgi:hypothetical protein
MTGSRTFGMHTDNQPAVSPTQEYNIPPGFPTLSATDFVDNFNPFYPASCTMGTWGLFPGGKARPELDADHSPL